MHPASRRAASSGYGRSGRQIPNSSCNSSCLQNIAICKPKVVRYSDNLYYIVGRSSMKALARAVPDRRRMILATVRYEVG